MTWTDGRCELVDGRVLRAWRDEPAGDGRRFMGWSITTPDGRVTRGSDIVATEREAQVAAEKAAGVAKDAPPRSAPLFCIQHPTVRCGESWKDKEHPCAVAGYECMSDSDTMRYEKGQPSERAMGFAEGVEAAFLDDEEVVRLRDENAVLRECNESMRDGMKGLRERLKMPAEGEGDVLRQACGRLDAADADRKGLRERVNALEGGRDEARGVARRLFVNDYPSWAVSGGPNNCKHGINAGIPCRRCDIETMQTWNPAATPDGEEA